MLFWGQGIILLLRSSNRRMDGSFRDNRCSYVAATLNPGPGCGECDAFLHLRQSGPELPCPCAALWRMDRLECRFRFRQTHAARHEEAYILGFRQGALRGLPKGAAVVRSGTPWR